MKRIFIVSIIMATIIVIALSGCITVKNIGGRSVTITKEDLSNTPDYFGDGIYYSYIYKGRIVRLGGTSLEALQEISDALQRGLEQKYGDEVTRNVPLFSSVWPGDFDVERVLGETAKKDITIEEAWYLRGSNSCCFSGLCQPSVVYPALVIRVSEADDYKLADLNFRRFFLFDFEYDTNSGEHIAYRHDDPYDLFSFCPHEVEHYVFHSG